MGFVEDDELVKGALRSPRVDVLGVGEQLKENDEEAERLILLDELVALLLIAGEHVPLMPMLPTQMLWINLVAAVTLSLPLAFEVLEPDAMRRPPRELNTPIFGGFVILRTILVAVLMAAGAVGLFLWEYSTEVPRQGHAIALREAQTMAVTTVVFFQIFYLVNCRSLRSSVFRVGFFSNRTVFAGVGALLLLQAGFIYLPFMQRIFGTASLELKAVGLSALVATVVLPLVGIEKAIRNRRSAKNGTTASLLIPHRSSA